MTDGRSWLPLHFAIVLGDEIKEDGVNKVHSHNPKAMQRHNLNDSGDDGWAGFLPGHFLCMQTHPNMSLMKHLSMCDMKAFRMSVVYTEDYEEYKGGRNSLQLAAEHSESVELLKDILQIDSLMAKKLDRHDYETNIYLGLLCERSHFASFHEMLGILLAANSSAEVVTDGLASYFRFLESTCLDMKVALAFIGSLLEANLGLMNDVTDDGDNILHLVCRYLEGELGVAVLSLLITKNSDEFGVCLRSPNLIGRLPIHHAAQMSTLNVVELLLKEYPESLYETENDGDNLLHNVPYERLQDIAIVNAKVKYFCNRNPGFY
jgi:hypothetical protein